MKSFLLALSFLTIFPINLKDISGQSIKNSIRFYPVVGLLIGIIFYIITFLFNNLTITSILILATWVIITGGFHLDGVADFFDALGSLKDREKAFEIMKDSRVGAMGSIAISMLLIFKFSLIKENLFIRPDVLIIAPVYGRYAIIFLTRTLNYAKKEGLGKFISDNNDKETFIITSFFLLILTILISSKLVLILLFYFIFLILIHYFYLKKFGGFTGDLLGCAVEVSELIVLFLGVLIGS